VAPALTAFVPSDEDVRLAKKSRLALAARLHGALPLDLGELSRLEDAPIRIPAPAADLLIQILDEMSRGNAVKVVPAHSELTTQEAANLLNISRPTLIRLLNDGQIEFHKVGTHRRIPLEGAMAFKRNLDQKRKTALAALVAYDQEIGI